MEKSYSFISLMHYIIFIFTMIVGNAYSQPQDGTIIGGKGSITGHGKNLEITQQTDKLVIDWRSFDINKGEIPSCLSSNIWIKFLPRF